MSYQKVLSPLLGCEILSVIRTVDHCVRIEVEIEIEEICGFAAGQLDPSLATRSHLLDGHRVEELKSTSIFHSPFIKPSRCRLVEKYDRGLSKSMELFVPLLYTFQKVPFCEHGI